MGGWLIDLSVCIAVPLIYCIFIIKHNNKYDINIPFATFLPKGHIVVGVN